MHESACEICVERGLMRSKGVPAKAGRVLAVHTCSVLPLISPAFILRFPCRWIKERERIDYISSGLGLSLPQPAREHFHRYRGFQDPAGSSNCASVQAAPRLLSRALSASPINHIDGCTGASFPSYSLLKFANKDDDPSLSYHGGLETT